MTNFIRALLILLTLTCFGSLSWAQDTTNPPGPDSTVGTEVAETPAVPSLDTGDTAWMMVASALVLMMSIPGLALFYAGMVRKKNVLSVLMQVFATICVLTLVWMIIGYSLAFTNGNAYVGDLSKTFLSGVELGSLSGTIPETVFMMFQMTFFMITPALIVGAFVDRMKFSAMLVFMILWSVIVYAPIAHWVWASTGFLFSAGVLDFAGGTVVHINAGIAGLVACIVLGKRIGYGQEPMAPHNLVLTLIGTSLLWVGWFGFNAGSALTAGDLAGVAFTNTMLATCTAVLGWLVVEQIRDGKPTTLGAASGAVAGLVAITPAAGYVSLLGGVIIGFVAGVVCALAVALKFRFGFDDSLDVVGVHLVGGIVGTLMVGLFGSTAVNSLSVDGLFYGGGFTQLGKQALAAGAVMVYSFVVAAILALIINKTIGFRVSVEDEVTGVDETEHAESAYDFSTLRGVTGLSHGVSARVPEPAPAVEATAGAGKES
jgi:Amt family ammonium transporter